MTPSARRVGAHGNGYVYVITANIVAKFHPEQGAHTQARLPLHPGDGGAVYNGFVISAKGFLIAKSIERGTMAPRVNSILGLRAAVYNKIPSILVAIDPDDLSVAAVAGCKVGRATGWQRCPGCEAEPLHCDPRISGAVLLFGRGQRHAE